MVTELRPELDQRELLVSRLATGLLDGGSRTVMLGEPGIGKSFLLDRIHQVVSAGGAVVLRAHGLDPDRSEPFLGLIDLLSSISAASMDHLPDVQRLALDVALARVDAPPVLPRMALRAGLGSLVERLLSEAPLVIAVDDVDKLDPATSRLLHYLVTRPPTAGRRIALIGTQQDKSRLSGKDRKTDQDLFGTSVVVVPGLSLEAFGSLASMADLSDPEIASLHAFTGGNPLWAFELQADPAPSTLGPFIPRSIAELVDTRLDALSPGLLGVFTILAALGEPRPAKLDELTIPGEGTVAEALASSLVVQVGERLRPAHPMLAVAALDRLTGDGAMALHARIAASSTDTWERAYHLELSVPPGKNETVAAALFDAGVGARRRGDVISAVETIQQSIARSAVSGDGHHERVLTLGEYLFLNGQYTQAAELLRELDNCPLDIAALDRALPLLLDSVFVARSRAEALAALTSLRLTGTPEPSLAAILSIYRAELSFGDVEDRLRDTAECLEVLAQAGTAPVTQHRALKSIIDRKIECAEGLDHDLLAQSAAMEEHLDLLTLTDSAFAQVGFNAWRVDDVTSSRRALESLVGTASSRGETVSASFFSTHLAVVSTMEGRLDEAASHLDTFSATDQWIDDPVPIYVFASGLLHIAAENDEAFESVLAGSGPASEVSTHLVGLALRGIKAARHEQWAAALPLLVEAHRRAVAEGIQEPGRRYWLDVELGEAQVASGDLEGADKTRGWLRHLAYQGQRPMMAGVSLRLEALICIARGDLTAAETLLEESVRGLDLSPFRVEAARSRLELGRLLRRTRRRKPAREMLSTALEQTEIMGDRPLARRLARELDLVPASRSETTLTPTENRIADAAANGMSNRQIATAHLIGVRTVETHLSAIYRKTGVPSRSGLSVWVRENPLN